MRPICSPNWGKNVISKTNKKPTNTLSCLHSFVFGVSFLKWLELQVKIPPSSLLPHIHFIKMILCNSPFIFCSPTPPSATQVTEKKDRFLFMGAFSACKPKVPWYALFSQKAQFPSLPSCSAAPGPSWEDQGHLYTYFCPGKAELVCISVPAAGSHGDVIQGVNSKLWSLQPSSEALKSLFPLP